MPFAANAMQMVRRVRLNVLSWIAWVVLLLAGGGCLEFGEHDGWDATAIFDFDALCFGPVPCLGGGVPVRGGRARVPG